MARSSLESLRDFAFRLPSGFAEGAGATAGGFVGATSGFAVADSPVAVGITSTYAESPG